MNIYFSIVSKISNYLKKKFQLMDFVYYHYINRISQALQRSPIIESDESDRILADCMNLIIVDDNVFRQSYLFALRNI